MPAWNGLQLVTPYPHLRPSGRCVSRRRARRSAPRRPRGRLSRPLKPEAIARGFLDACLAELDALKPGNVHRFADGPQHEGRGFRGQRRSCRAQHRARSGLRWVSASAARSRRRAAAVGQNTNLGIVLLARRSPRRRLIERRRRSRKAACAASLPGSTVDDAREAYRGDPRHQAGRAWRSAGARCRLRAEGQLARGHARGRGPRPHRLELHASTSPIFSTLGLPMAGPGARALGRRPILGRDARLSRLPRASPRHADRAEIRDPHGSRACATRPARSRRA